MAHVFNFIKEHIELFIGFALGMTIMTLALYKESKHEYDINNDGVVDIKDMLVIQKYILDNEEVK